MISDQILIDAYEKGLKTSQLLFRLARTGWTNARDRQKHFCFRLSRAIPCLSLESTRIHYSIYSRLVRILFDINANLKAPTSCEEENLCRVFTLHCADRHYCVGSTFLCRITIIVLLYHIATIHHFSDLSLSPPVHPSLLHSYVLYQGDPVPLCHPQDQVLLSPHRPSRSKKPLGATKVNAQFASVTWLITST